MSDESTEPQESAEAEASEAAEPVAEAPARERARVGQFVDIIDGPFKGLFGVFTQRLENGKALFRNRDHHLNVDQAVVDEEHLTPSQRTGGR